MTSDIFDLRSLFDEKRLLLQELPRIEEIPKSSDKWLTNEIRELHGLSLRLLSTMNEEDLLETLRIRFGYESFKSNVQEAAVKQALKGLSDYKQAVKELKRNYWTKNRQLEKNVAAELKILKGLEWHPYKIQILQNITDEDKQNRLEFADDEMERMENNHNRLANFLFSDEARFHLDGGANQHNHRYCRLIIRIGLLKKHSIPQGRLSWQLLAIMGVSARFYLMNQ
uniref:Uncharacterized protein n=1 Tax=Romanomermis culicivorax TaxID=13658 RepID=A0A915J0P5_ROMCU